MRPRCNAVFFYEYRVCRIRRIDGTNSNKIIDIYTVCAIFSRNKTRRTVKAPLTKFDHLFIAQNL